MARVDLSTVVVRSEEPLTARVDDETVMLDARQSAYFGLDGTGTEVWDLLAEPIAVGDLCDRLVARFEVDEDTCRRDVLAFVGDLLEARLVETRRLPV